jgi:high affinity sulfate transporter 1
MATDPLHLEQGQERRRIRWPLLQGILPFDRSRAATDILAGLTLAALGIPEVMGYTKIIGTPVITGIYTILVPMLVFALLGSSRYLVVGADSATAAIVAAALAAMAAPESPRFVALTSLIAVLAGGMLLLARILRLGFLADFLSRTVLVGFLSGVGVQVACGQLHGMLGIEKGGHGFFRQLAFIFEHISQTQPLSVILCGAVLVVIVAFERFAPRFPGALLAVVGSIVASATLGLGERGLALVGTVPSGLPRVSLPDVTTDDMVLLLPVTFSCFIVIIAQSAATSRAYALRNRDAFSENVDLVGLSLANAAAGLTGTFVVNGSPTKTAMVYDAGGRSQVSQLATVAMVLVVLLFLTRPLSYLPDVVLSTIVFVIGMRLIDLRGLKEIYRKKPREFAVAIATAVMVMVVGVEQGIIFAMAMSLIQHVRRSYQPHTAVVMTRPPEHWVLEPVAPGKMLEPGLIMYWFGAELFYANSLRFADEVRRIVADSPTPVRWLVVDASAITAIDFSAGNTLAELQQDLSKQGVTLAMTRVSPSLRGDLDRLELTGLIGADQLFDSRHMCIAAYKSTLATTPAL